MTARQSRFYRRATFALLLVILVVKLLNRTPFSDAPFHAAFVQQAEAADDTLIEIQLSDPTPTLILSKEQH